MVTTAGRGTPSAPPASLPGGGAAPALAGTDRRIFVDSEASQGRRRRQQQQQQQQQQDHAQGDGQQPPRAAPSHAPPLELLVQNMLEVVSIHKKVLNQGKVDPKWKIKVRREDPLRSVLDACKKASKKSLVRIYLALATIRVRI